MTTVSLSIVLLIKWIVYMITSNTVHWLTKLWVTVPSGATVWTSGLMPRDCSLLSTRHFAEWGLSSNSLILPFDPIAHNIMYADVDPAATGGRAFRQARPLSDQVVECLKFLRCIEHIAITDVTKGDYVISVYFKGARAPSCSTKQSFSKFRKLHKACVGWSSYHVELSPAYGVAPCLYCRAFNDAYEIDQWPGGTDRLFASKTKLMRVLEARLNEYVQRARGEAHGAYLCEGIENIPFLVSTFLLEGVDMSMLRTME